MKLLLVAVLLVVSVCALPRPRITKLVFDELKFKNSLKKVEGAGPILPKEVRKEMVQELSIKPLIDQKTANLVADTLFKFADKWLLDNHYDPYDLPDLKASFEYKLIITYHGSADLHNGDLKDISTMHRVGDVQVSEDVLNKVYHLDFDIVFNDVHVDYDYHAEIMGLGPKGVAHGTAKDVDARVSLAFDEKAQKIELLNLQLSSPKHIDVTFSGNSLVDWLLDLLADAVTSLFKKTIWDAIDNVLNSTLDKVIDELNKDLGAIIGMIPQKAELVEIEAVRPQRVNIKDLKIVPKPVQTK